VLLFRVPEGVITVTKPVGWRQCQGRWPHRPPSYRGSLHWWPRRVPLVDSHPRRRSCAAWSRCSLKWFWRPYHSRDCRPHLSHRPHTGECQRARVSAHLGRGRVRLIEPPHLAGLIPARLTLN